MGFSLKTCSLFCPPWRVVSILQLKTQNSADISAPNPTRTRGTGPLRDHPGRCVSCKRGCDVACVRPLPEHVQNPGLWFLIYDCATPQPGRFEKVSVHRAGWSTEGEQCRMRTGHEPTRGTLSEVPILCASCQAPLHPLKSFTEETRKERLGSMSKWLGLSSGFAPQQPCGKAVKLPEPPFLHLWHREGARAEEKAICLVNPFLNAGSFPLFTQYLFLKFIDFKIYWLFKIYYLFIDFIGVTEVNKIT